MEDFINRVINVFELIESNYNLIEFQKKYLYYQVLRLVLQSFQTIIH